MTTKNYEYDYYNILNVSFNATPEEIKSSYRKLAKIYHPDLGGSDYEFKRILKAYETLMDEHERKKYNKWYEEKYMSHAQREIQSITVNVFDCLNCSLYTEIRRTRPNSSMCPPDLFTDEYGHYYALRHPDGTLDNRLFFCKPDKWHKTVSSFNDDYDLYEEPAMNYYTELNRFKPIYALIILAIIIIVIHGISSNQQNSTSSTAYNPDIDTSTNTESSELTQAEILDSEFTEETPPEHGDILDSFEPNKYQKEFDEYMGRKSTPTVPLSNLEIKIPDTGDEYYYIKVIDIDTNEIAQSVFMHPNTTVEIPVPLGIYTIRYACGKTWYGYENLFGHSGSYAICDDVFEFTETVGWTITLYPVVDGNMETEYIDFEDF